MGGSCCPLALKLVYVLGHLTHGTSEGRCRRPGAVPRRRPQSSCAAKHFGVTEAAISQRVRKLRIATSKIVALERAADVVDRQLTAAQRLQHVQRVILTS
jgi:hypothetical protein